MQVSNVYRWAIILFSIAILFFLGCENNLLTESDNQGLEEWTNSSLDKGGSNSTVPIALARADNPRDFFPDFLGEIVTVQGVITSLNFSPNEGAYHYIQDNSAGMQIFGWAPVSPPVLEMGDEVVVKGVISQYFGNTFIFLQSGSDVQIVGTGTLKKPKKIQAVQLDDQVGERIEGELVVLENVKIVDGDQFPPQGSNGVIRIVDSKGDTAKVLIDKDSDIDGSATPNGLFNLTGNVIQFSYSTPADDFYEIHPRGLFDIDQL